MNKKNRNREYCDSCHRGGGLGAWVKKVKGFRSTNWLSRNSHGDVKQSVGNIVNNILKLCMVSGTRFIEMFT